MKDMEPKVASPARGRKTMDVASNGTAEVLHPDYEGAAISVVAELRQDSVAMPRGELAQSLRMAEAAGRISAFQFNEAINRVGMLKLFQDIRDNRAYKGTTVIMRSTGETVTVNTWEDFCTAHGYSHKKINEDLQNLTTFGGDFLELQDKLGLGYRELRLLRKGLAELPPEERQAVLADVAEAEGPEEVKEKLADMRLELAQAKAREKDLLADMEAKEKVSKGKTEKLDALEEQVARLTSIRPDDKAMVLAEKNTAALRQLDDCCNAVWQAVLQLCAQGSAILANEDSTDDTCTMVHGRVSALAEVMTDAITRSGIDVDLSAYLQIGKPANDGE